MERRRRDDHCLIRLLRYNLLLYKQRQTPLGASTASDATTTPPTIFTHILGVMAIVVLVVVIVGDGCGHSCGCSLPFSVYLGDAAPAEPHWYLYSDFVYHINTYGSVVKHGL